jgi:putative transposase
VGEALAILPSTAVWMTAAEIAAARLPAMPTSEFRIRERAARDGWRQRARNGRGGGAEFLVDDLPAAARRALARRAGCEVAPAPARPQQSTAALAGWQQATMNARTVLLQKVDELAAELGVTAAIERFAEASQAGKLPPDLAALVPVANARSPRNGAASLSARSLYRWRQHRETSGFTALAPFETARERETPAWADALTRLWRSPTKRPLRSILRDLPRLLQAGVEAPSYDQARRFINSMSAVDRERGRRGPQDLKALKPYVRRTTDQLLPLDVIISDGHCFDADDVAHPIHGRPFRPELSAVLDVATRRAIGWAASLAEATWATVDALRQAAQHGLPAMFYTDRGAGYVNATVEAMLARMGCSHPKALPYNSQARGLIERAHQSIWIDAARTRPGYLGRDMDKTARRAFTNVVKLDLRTRGVSRHLTPWADFLAWCQAVIDAYNDRPHRGLAKIRCPQTGRMRHPSPNEAWTAHCARGWEPVLLTDPELEDLFRPYEERRTLRGAVSLFGNTYWLPGLEHHHGQMVRVGYDIHDAGHVWVRDLQDRLIGRAELDGMARPYMPLSAVEKAREARGKRRLQTIRNNEAEVLAEMGPGIIDLVARRAAQAPLIELTPEQEELADAALARIEAEDAEIPAPVETSGGRPIFNDDFTWARWVLENPDQAEAEDHALLQRRMRSLSFRMALGLEEDESEATTGA